MLKTSLRRMRGRPVRTALTLLQLVLGAFAMTLALSLLDPSLGSTAGSAPERFGVVARSQVGQANGGGYRIYAVFDEKGLGEFRKLAPDVELTALSGGTPRVTVAQDGVLYEFRRSLAVSPEYFEIAGLTPSRGSFFTSSDEALQAPVVVLSEEAAHILFGDADPLQRELQVMPASLGSPAATSVESATTFRVVGTFEEPPAAGTSRFFQPVAYFPLWNDGSNVGNAPALTLDVLAKPGRAAEARSQALSAAASAFGTNLSKQGLSSSMLEVAEAGGYPIPTAAATSPTAVIFAVFGLVAIIAGSIGIFSITLVDVVDRTREIGIRRAMGASRADMTRELVLEATVQSAIGGIVGIGLAAALIPVLQARFGTSLFGATGVSFDPLAALTVLVLVVVLGGLLAMAPAARASRMRPAEALWEA